MSNKFVVVDLGGTQVRVALGNKAGIIGKIKIGKTDGEILITLEELIRQLMSKNKDIKAIGVACPGPMDAETGTIFDEPGNLPNEIIDRPLKHLLEKKFGVRVYFGNDAQMAALGEHRFGAGRKFRNMIYMGIGTGIGGGLIIDNKLYQGTKEVAGEIGQHLFINLDYLAEEISNNLLIDLENMKKVPQKLEDFASGKGIANKAQELVKSGHQSLMLEMVNGNISQIDSITVVAAAKKGDLLANNIICLTGYCVGIALTNLIHTLSPDGIVIGGGVSKAGDLLLQPIRKTIRNHGFQSMTHRVKITKSTKGNESGLLGALAMVSDIQFGKAKGGRNV